MGAVTNLPHSVDAVMARAQRLCEAKGMRLTGLRRRAIAALARAGRPVKAYDLLADLSEDDAPAKPASAYRALEFLQTLGLVHRVSGLNAFVLCTHGGGAHKTHLFLCEQCGGAEEFADGSQAVASAPSGFQVRWSVMEHYGVCAACADAAQE